MKKILEKLKENRGSAHFTGLFILIALILLSTPVVIFLTTNIRLSHIRENCQNTLDVYTITTGKEIVKSIKSGHDYTSSIKKQNFLKGLKEQLSVEIPFKGHDKNGNTIYEITSVEADFVYNKTLKTTVKFKIDYHYYFLGKRLFISSKKFDIDALYNLKY